MFMSSSLEEKILRDMEDNVYNYTKDGKCSGCGACCSNMLPMNDEEIGAIHKFIRKHKIKESKHFIPTSSITVDMICPFRDNDNHKCTIYPVRPMICRAFICDNEKRAKSNRALINSTRKIVFVREEFFLN